MERNPKEAFVISQPCPEFADGRDNRVATVPVRLCLSAYTASQQNYIPVINFTLNSFYFYEIVENPPCV